MGEESRILLSHYLPWARSPQSMQTDPPNLPCLPIPISLCPSLLRSLRVSIHLSHFLKSPLGFPLSVSVPATSTLAMPPGAVLSPCLPPPQCLPRQ